MTEPTQNPTSPTLHEHVRAKPVPDPAARDMLKQPDVSAAPDSAPTGEGVKQRSTGTSAVVQIGLVLSIALGAFGLYRTYTMPTPQSVYTVNLGALTTAKEIQQQGTTDPNVYRASIQDFVKSLKGELDALSSRGVIVIKSDSVLTDVPSVDLTARLARHFGLESEMAQVPAREAEQRARYTAQLRAQLGLGGLSVPGAAASPAAPASDSAPGPSPASGTTINPAPGSDGLAHLD